MTTQQHDIASRTVDWYETHRFAERLRLTYPEAPAAGTAEWLALDDDNPAKCAALAMVGPYHVLNTALRQEALAQASKDVAAAVDWPAVARELQQLDAARKAGTRIERITDTETTAA